MSLLLCHDCFNWVEPADGRCPECRHAVDATAPDPPLDVLQDVIGELVCRLGEISVPRRLLPEHGTLYATTNGLYFVPHEQERITRFVEAHSAGTSLIWTLAAMAWFPLALVKPFIRTTQWQPRTVTVYRPQHLTVADSHRLSRLLMQNPGVFFIPRKTIRDVGRRRRHWRIHRYDGPLLKLHPASSRRGFDERMSRLFAADSWQELPVSMDRGD